MRVPIHAFLGLAIFLTSCAGTPKATEGNAGPLPEMETRGQAPTPPEVPAEPTGPIIPSRFVRLTRSGITVEAMAFDARTHEIKIADQPAGPGSIWASAKAAGQSLDGLGAINGGFFTPEGKPLGLVVSDGRRAGALNRSSSLGSGFYAAGGRSTPRLVRRDKFRSTPEALQSGPFLIESGKKVAGLSDKSSSARSFIATDGRNGWIIARTGACSLSQLGLALQGAEVAGVSIKTALNLDGGRSSDLWVSGGLEGGPVHTRPLWNKQVRNFLVVRKLP